MEYTPEHHEQDKRIAQHVYRKHFKGHWLREDLIQTAIYELWRLRKQADSRDYVAHACDTAHKKMVSLIRKEIRHMGMDSLNRQFGKENQRLLLSDTIAIEQDTAQDLCECRDLVKKLLPPNMKEMHKKIILLHLKHYTQEQIAYRLGVSQQYVSRIIRNFRFVSRQMLEGGSL